MHFNQESFKIATPQIDPLTQAFLRSSIAPGELLQLSLTALQECDL